MYKKCVSLYQLDFCFLNCRSSCDKNGDITPGQPNSDAHQTTPVSQPTPATPQAQTSTTTTTTVGEKAPLITRKVISKIGVMVVILTVVAVAVVRAF